MFGLDDAETPQLGGAAGFLVGNFRSETENESTEEESSLGRDEAALDASDVTGSAGRGIIEDDALWTNSCSIHSGEGEYYEITNSAETTFRFADAKMVERGAVSAIEDGVMNKTIGYSDGQAFVEGVRPLLGPNPTFESDGTLKGEGVQVRLPQWKGSQDAGQGNIETLDSDGRVIQNVHITIRPWPPSGAYWSLVREFGWEYEFRGGPR